MDCDFCGKDMSKAHECIGGIDESVIAGERRCHDCGVAPGACHHPGCDVERCSCGGQALSCGCDDAIYFRGRESRRWTGLWPGVAECRHFGLFCRDEPGKCHIPCERDHPDAHEDLNRWYMEGAKPIPAVEEA